MAPIYTSGAIMHFGMKFELNQWQVLTLLKFQVLTPSTPGHQASSASYAVALYQRKLPGAPISKLRFNHIVGACGLITSISASVVNAAITIPVSLLGADFSVTLWNKRRSHQAINRQHMYSRQSGAKNRKVSNSVVVLDLTFHLYFSDVEGMDVILTFIPARHQWDWTTAR